MTDAIDIGIAGIRNEMERMQVLTEDERTALVDELAEASYIATLEDAWECVDRRPWAEVGNAVRNHHTKIAKEACLPIIDRLLAERDLDAALDRPDVAEQLGREYAKQRNGEWDYDNRPSYKSHCDGNAVAEVESALITIRNAVAQAKAATGEVTV